MGIVLTGRTSGGAGLRSLVRGTFALGQIRARWWGVMLALSAVPNMAALLITAALNGSKMPFTFVPH
jgi:hypothetical protein